MAFHYSEPFEQFLEGARADKTLTTARIVIVGSGYGGAVAAYRLSGLIKEAHGRQHQLLVLERGREYALGEFPQTLDELPGFVRAARSKQSAPGPNDDALFDVRMGEGVDVLVGCGLGGTSLINANVALPPTPGTFAKGHWPASLRAESQDEESRLNDAFRRVQQWLCGTRSDKDLQELRSLSKFQAFERYARELKFKVEPAPVAVTLGAPGTTRVNAAGVRQKACTRCGNCVTGCNVGAKNTLAMNLIPAARERGAKFITGVQVLRVEPGPGVEAHETSEPAWRVLVRPITRETRVRFDGVYAIDADIVVLAAGTLGSTEILQRSSADRQLTLSPCLGSRFSTNGDALAMSYGENALVHAVGHADPHDPDNNCGPTITAVARGRTASGEPFTLEEGAIPASLTEVFGEVVTTGAQFARLGNNRLPGWFTSAEGRDADPLSVQSGAIENTQVFLVMADDGARGKLQFSSASAEELDDTLTVPQWPATSTDLDGTVNHDPSPGLTSIETTLAKFDCHSGQNHGQFVHNPLWKLLPPSATAVMAGRFPGGRLLSVHPLGGCPMADHGRDGVVNDLGEVFVGASAATHHGLYVLDGSIIPGALGVNPFLTIASLAWRACDAIVERLGGEVEPCLNATPGEPPSLPEAAGRPSPQPAPRIILTERLVGKLVGTHGSDPAIREGLRKLYPDDDAGVERCFGENGLILQITSQPFELSALQRPGDPLTIEVDLHRNVTSAQQSAKDHIHGVPKELLGSETVIACGTGTVTIMSPNEPRGWLDRLVRTIDALRAYLARRESLCDLCRRQGSRSKGSAAPRQSLLAVGLSMCRVAAMHGTYRDFKYRIDLRGVSRGRASDGAGAGSPCISFTGTKRIAWRPGHPPLWQAFTELRTRVSFPADGEPTAPAVAAADFRVDVENLVGDGLLQIAPGSSVPRGIMSCLGFVLRMARCAMQAGFWEFGAPDYPPPGRPLESKPSLPPRLKKGARLETRELRVPLSGNTADHHHATSSASQLPLTVPLWMHCYRAPEDRARRPREPVLLIHGLAQGSLIYAHPAMKESMADYFSEAGYDVWLVDYRLSNQFTEHEVPYRGWSMDEIGKYDVPEAVKAVLAQYPPETRLHVFAHCVGAVGTAMAILNGSLTCRQLASVVLNAIHPWTVPAAPNRVRAKLGVFFRDYLNDGFFDPIIQTSDKVGVEQTLLDRLGFSLARLGERVDGHHGRDDTPTLANAICDRMTFLYGRMWKHQHVKALHRHWKDLVGRAPGTVQRHLYYVLLHRRLVNRRGLNVYLLEQNLIKNWQGIRTLFIHGEDSRVFDPQSATESAVRLREVFRRAQAQSQPTSTRSTPVGLKRIAGYGHMDVILANTASKESYCYVREFFEKEFDNGITSASGLRLDVIEDRDDPLRSDSTRLLTGPVMRAARLDGDDLILRLWLELPVDNTYPSAIKMPGAHPIVCLPAPLAKSLGKQYCWADVTLPADDYRPIVPEVKPAESVISHFAPTRRLLEDLYSGLPASDALARVHEYVQPDVTLEQPAWLRRLRARSRDPDHKRDCRFLVGSCFYPGTPFDQSNADQAFHGMLKLLKRDIDCDLLFLVGDQIYADATNGILDPTPWRDRYVDRYRQAFQSPAAAAVLSALPCHFAIDDHEFVDNFAGCANPHLVEHPHADQEGRESAALKRGSMTEEQFRHARDVAQAYMGSGRSARRFGNSTAPDRMFWYALDDGTEIRCPAFILDTRSERERPPARSPARLMSPEQMQAFKDWLSRYQKDPRPKFVFLGSPIIPLTREFDHKGVWMRQDGPTGYPKELAEIVRHIVRNDIHGVVFVGGDPHLSCAAHMRLIDKEQSVEALHIISSGLYAPLPFANLSPSAVDWSPANCRITHPDTGSDLICYTQSLLFVGAPHFLRVTAVPEDPEDPEGHSWTIGAQAYDSSGKEVGEPFTHRLQTLPRPPTRSEPVTATSTVLTD